MERLRKLIFLTTLVITVQDVSAKIEARKVLHIPEKIIGGVIDIVQNHNKNKPAPTGTVSQGQMQAQSGYIQGPQQYTLWNAGYMNNAYGTGYQQSYPSGQYMSGAQTQPTQASSVLDQSQGQFQFYPSQSGQFQSQQSIQNHQPGNQNQQVQFQNQGYQGSNQMQSQVQSTNQQSQLQSQNTQGLQNQFQQSPGFSGQFSQQQNPQINSQNANNMFTGTVNNQIGHNHNVQFSDHNNQNGQYVNQNHQNSQTVGQNYQNVQFVGQNHQNSQTSQNLQSTQFFGPNHQSNQFIGQNLPRPMINPQYQVQNQQSGIYQGQIGQIQGSNQMIPGQSGTNGPTCVCQAWTKPQLEEENAGRSEEIIEKPESL